MARFTVNPNPPQTSQGQTQERAEITVRIENDKVILELPIKLEESSSGKSTLLYSSHGFQNSEFILGQEIPELAATRFEGGRVAFSGSIFVMPRK